MAGWISIYRPIKDHWIWTNPIKFQWWINILLTVNHKTAKVNVGNSLIECKKGQSVRSLGSWAIEFNTTKKTVKTFFELLQSDDMIRIENMKITTRLTVCNYDSYQDTVNTKETASKRKLPTNNNDNKEIKDLYIELIPFVENYGKDLTRDFYNYWSEPNKKGKQRWELEKTWDTKRRLIRWNKNNFGKNPNKTELINGHKTLTEKEKKDINVNINWTYIHIKNTYKKVHIDDKGNYYKEGLKKIYL